MNAYRHKLIELKAALNAEYAVAASEYEVTPTNYYKGLCDAINMCLQLVSNAIREADKEEQ